MSSSTTTPTVYGIPSITSYTNKGALPTPLTLPAACLNDVLDFQVHGLGLTPYTYYTQGCALSTCCPSGNFYSSAFQWYSEYYSPAVCPSGYEPVAADPIISTAPGETVRFCCPSTMATGNFAQQYPNSLSLTAPYYNWACQNMNPSVVSSTVSAFDNLINQDFVSLRTSSLPYFYEIAYPIQIRWRAEQLRSGTIVSATVASTSVASSSAAATTAKPDAGLSSGDIAGISIGAIAFALLLVSAGLVCFYRRRRARNTEQSAVLASDIDHSSKGYHTKMGFAPGKTHRSFATPELDSRMFHELNTSRQPVELPESNNTATVEARTDEDKPDQTLSERSGPNIPPHAM